MNVATVEVLSVVLTGCVYELVCVSPKIHLIFTNVY